MRLFLIRHGETVDNVAGLLAGSRDSALTVHGVLQAQRLASHLAASVVATHIFSSNLSRAVKTAQAVGDAQKEALGMDVSHVQLPELREKDFGSSEGVKWGRSDEKKRVDDAETGELMRARTERFVNEHLAPLLDVPSTSITPCVVVVAHGIILGVLFKVLCAKFSQTSITLAPEAQRTTLHSSSPILSPSWSNTGYVEMVISPSAALASDKTKPWQGRRLHVEHVNCVAHLNGLKKTRGGIGSARFDDKQRTMDSFFRPTSKKRKLEDADEQVHRRPSFNGS